uniref:ORF3 protein n=1 Tax=Rice tungro spherical virus TaxID=35287 RepID=Q98647_9SECO|nr:ORF3 [Rice tungro spherical virus]
MERFHHPSPMYIVRVSYVYIISFIIFLVVSDPSYSKDTIFVLRWEVTLGCELVVEWRLLESLTTIELHRHESHPMHESGGLS